MVGVSLKTIIWVAVEGNIWVQYAGYQCGQLMGSIRSVSRSILESYPISGLPNILIVEANQADVCCYISLQVDMGVRKGKYNGVQTT